MVKLQALILGAFFFSSFSSQVLPIDTHAAIQSHMNLEQSRGSDNRYIGDVVACKTAPGQSCNQSGPRGDNIVTNGCYDGVLGSANRADGQQRAKNRGCNGHGREDQPDKACKKQVDNSARPQRPANSQQNGRQFGTCQHCQNNQITGHREQAQCACKSQRKSSQPTQQCNQKQQRPQVCQEVSGECEAQQPIIGGIQSTCSSKKPKGWEQPRQQHQNSQNKQCLNNQPQGQPGHQCQRIPRVCGEPQVKNGCPHKTERSVSKGSKSGSKDCKQSHEKECSIPKKVSPGKTCTHQVQAPINTCRKGRCD